MRVRKVLLRRPMLQLGDKPGPVIIVISGQSGPAAYQSYAARSGAAMLNIADLLQTGRDIINRR